MLTAITVIIRYMTVIIRSPDLAAFFLELWPFIGVSIACSSPRCSFTHIVQTINIRHMEEKSVTYSQEENKSVETGPTDDLSVGAS